MTLLRTMSWGVVNDVMLLVHGDASPGELEWSAYAHVLVGAAKAGTIRSLLVFTEGPGPKPDQRKLISHVPKNFKSVVLTQARVARGVVAALSWLGVNINAFAPQDFDAACAWLDIERPRRAASRAERRHAG
jgi:hypothetical protein